MNRFCPDTCPVCGLNLKAEGGPEYHQHATTGAECTFRWDVEAARQAELDEEFPL